LALSTSSKEIHFASLFSTFSGISLIFLCCQARKASTKGSLKLRRGKLNKTIRLAIAGDPTAQEELCRLYAKPVLFQTRLVVKNKSDVEDVAQKVMIEMLRSISNLKSPYAFRSWLQRIIYNAALKQNVQAAKEADRSDLLEKAEFIIDEGEFAHPEETLEAKVLSQHMTGYLDKLPTAQATVLVLYYYEEQSYKEIADILGVSIGSVSSTMSKAKKNLKKMLDADAASEVFGIVSVPPLLRKSIRHIVINEVESHTSDEAVERLVEAGRVAIAATAVTAGVVGASTGASLSAETIKNILLAVAGVVLLGAIAAITIVLSQPTVEVAPPVTESKVPALTVDPVAPVVETPDVEVVYSIQVAQGQTDGTSVSNADDPQDYEIALNPLTSKIVANDGEKLDRWVLTDAQGTTLAEGTNSEIDITSLKLSEGQFLVTWHMLSAKGDAFLAHWEFIIDTP
jgi:RNA polymerase sigma-70 factor (ECF subfamily)